MFYDEMSFMDCNRTESHLNEHAYAMKPVVPRSLNLEQMICSELLNFLDEGGNYLATVLDVLPDVPTFVQDNPKVKPMAVINCDKKVNAEPNNEFNNPLGMMEENTRAPDIDFLTYQSIVGPVFS